MKQLQQQAFSGIPSVVVGKITAVSGPVLDTGGRLAGSVRYTIAASIHGAGVVEYARQLPEVRLWPDDMAIDADRLLYTSVMGVLIAGELRWHFYEPPAMGGCDSAPGANLVTVRTPGGGVVTRQDNNIDLPPVTGGTTDAPAPPSAPGGGEE